MSFAKEIEKDSKKKTIRKFAIFALAWCGILYGSYVFYFSKNTADMSTSERKTYSVSVGNIKTFIQSDGRVALKDELNLDFANVGIIQKILLKEGDPVEKWTVIASLDVSYLDIAMEKAKIALDTAKLNYEIKKNGTSATELDISQKQVDRDLVSLEGSKKETDSDIEAAKRALEVARKIKTGAEKQAKIDVLWSGNATGLATLDYRTALSNAEFVKKQEREKYADAANKLVMETGQMIANMEKYLHDIDMLLWISDTNRDKNDAFEDYLSAKNTASKTLAEAGYRETQKKFDEFHTKWSELQKNGDFPAIWNSEDLSKYAYELRNVASLLNKTLSYSVEAVKNSISTSSFPQTAIDSYLANFENALANSKDGAANYMLTLQSMSEAKTAMEAKIDTAENLVLTFSGKLDIARSSLQKTILQGELSVDAAQEKILALEFDVRTLETKRSTALALSQSQVNISQASLKDKKQVDNRDLEPLNMAILQAQKTYDEAKKKKNDSELIAPMKGKIAKINGKIWENTMSLKVPFVTIINTDAFYVEASVEEGDIVKVKNGQAVHISFDAIESLTLTGKVVYVNEKADIDENEIVSYGVEVLFANTDPRIRDGLTASVDFITKEVNGVLTIPVQSVKNRNGKATVVLENRKIREVVTGFTDGKMVEAISWLKKWETVTY